MSRDRTTSSPHALVVLLGIEDELSHQREVQAFIDDRFGGRASEVTRLSGGDWSQAYALSLDGTQVVARFGIHGEDYEKDRIASGWASDELPIPKVLELDETKVGFFALSSRARGDFLDELRSEQIRGVLPSLFRTMDAIRAIDVSATEGYGNWTSDGHGPQRTWREALLHKFADDPLATEPMDGGLHWKVRPAVPETLMPH